MLSTAHGRSKKWLIHNLQRHHDELLNNSIYFCIYSITISPLNIGQCFVFTNSALILSSHHSITGIIYCI